MSMEMTTTGLGDQQADAMQGTENDEEPIPFPSLLDVPQPITESEGMSRDHTFTLNIISNFWIGRLAGKRDFEIDELR